MSISPSPSGWSLLAGSTLYPLVFYLSIPKDASPRRVAQSREAISIFHCTLMTLLSLDCLSRSSLSTLLAAPENSRSIAGVEDRDLPIITTRSEYANAITALETAYLLQDSIILLYAARQRSRARLTGTSTVKGLNIKHLAWHHAGLTCALGTLQVYIAQRRDKGISLIIMMMLMNASSPIGTLRWFLVNFKPHWTRSIAFSTVSYLCMYALCRVYLVYYILRVFGAQKGQSALQTYLRMKWQCQLGTGAMGVVNSSWLIIGVMNFCRRMLTDFSSHEKKS